MGLYAIGKGALPESSDVQQLIGTFTGQLDAGTLTLFAPIAAPSSAPTATINTASGALNGTYGYVYTWVTGIVASDGTLNVTGETLPSSVSASISPVNQQGSGANVASGPPGTIARRLYRNAATGSASTGPFLLVAQIADNTTTTFADNVADASLGAEAPTANSTGSRFLPALTSVRNQLLTSTAATTVWTFTPVVDGIYRVMSYLRVITAATTVTLTIAWADSGGDQSYTPAALNAASVAVGSHSVIDYTFESVAGTPITLTVTAGTASQVYITSALEGVA